MYFYCWCLGGFGYSLYLQVEVMGMSENLYRKSGDSLRGLQYYNRKTQ